MDTVLNITRFVYRALGDNLMLIILGLAGLAMTGIAQGQDMQKQRLLDCVAEERAEWSVVGKADFVGEPWTHSWTTTKQWDNATGTMVAITPIVNTFPVPGEQLKVEFEDGSTFVYGEPLTDKNRGIWADNLGSLARYGMDDLPPPYTAIKRQDGAIFLLAVEADNTCGVGWYLGT